MRDCPKYGSEISDKSRFCPDCGAAVVQGEAKQKDEGRCPYCGEPISSFTAYCPACGNELRNQKSAQSIAELAEKLERIDNKYEGQTPSLAKQREIAEKKASLIRSFPIPNSVSYIKEFIILASANVDPNAYSVIKDEENDEVISPDRVIADAWFAKCKQAMNKARALMSNQDELDKLQALVDDAVHSKRKGGWKSFSGKYGCLIAICLAYALLMGFIFLMASCEKSSKTDHDEIARLEQIEDGIKTDLENGSYLEALLKADSLETDYSDTLERQWGVKRDYWIDHVVVEASAHGVDLSERAAQLKNDGSKDDSSSVWSDIGEQAKEIKDILFDTKSNE